MSDVGQLSNGSGRAALEQQAEAVRSRLERRLDELDERRDRIVEVARMASRPPASVVLIGAASAIGVALLIHQLRKRPSTRRRVGARVFDVPAQQDGFVVKALKGAALSFIATLAQRLSARGVDRLLQEQHEESREMAPPAPRAAEVRAQ